MLHHHLIPVSHDRSSAVSNAYEFLNVCENNGISLILHGHQHINLETKIGNNRCKISGVGSLFCMMGGNINNQFKIIDYNNDGSIDVSLYRYQGDIMQNGVFGKFIKEG